MPEQPRGSLLLNNYPGEAYLNTAAEGLPLRAAADAVMRYLGDKSRGEPGRVGMWEAYQLARERAARLFGVTAPQTALVSSTTEALNTIARSIDWRDGDEVVFTSVEFPSNIFPWVALRRLGVRTRIVEPRDGLVSTDDILEQITPRTRLVTMSQVSYATGQHLDPRPVWERVRTSRTLLCVDATQAAARVPVDGTLADFTVASAFKWMNSLHGSAVLTVGPRVLDGELTGPAGWLSAESCYAPDRFERFRPRDDAQRFQAGMPNFESVYALAAALEFHTPERVVAHRDELEPLVARLYDGLASLGLRPLVPERAADRAGIVPFACPESARVKVELARRGVHVHGDDGRLRAALHWYNTAEHVDRYLEALPEALEAVKRRLEPAGEGFDI